MLKYLIYPCFHAGLQVYKSLLMYVGHLLSGFWISIANPPELDGTILRIGTRKLDGLIRRQPLCLDHLATFNNPVVDPSFQPGYEQDLFAGEQSSLRHVAS
jgi:hypothetical protein